MAITKTSTYEYAVNGEASNASVQVVRIDTFSEDDVELSKAHHRYVIYPHRDWSSESTEIKSVCDALFTAAVIKKYLADRKAVDGWEPQETID